MLEIYIVIFKLWNIKRLRSTGTLIPKTLWSLEGYMLTTGVMRSVIFHAGIWFGFEVLFVQILPFPFGKRTLSLL